MTQTELQSFDDSFRNIEAEFQSRPDHQPVENVPAQITLPDEVTFQQATARREAQERLDRERNAAARKERREREKREKRVGRLKKAFAVAAIFMTYKSGGLIDMAGDQVTDAGDVAADVLQVQPYEIPEEMDGIAFEDYSQKVQDEIVSEGQEREEKDEKIQNTLVDIFSDIDKNGSDGLLAEVEIYKVNHGEKFVSAEKISQTQEQIDNSKTNTEAIHFLNYFMDSEYGIKATFGTDHLNAEMPFIDRTGEVKDIAKAYTEVFGSLPKDFVAKAEIDSIQISNEKPTNKEKGGVMGRYSPDSNRIQIFVKEPAFNAVLEGAEKIPFVGEMNHQTVIAHELGHAFDEKLKLPVTGTNVEANGMDSKGFVEHAARTMVYRSELPAFDAAENESEHTADVLAGILARESTGLADTNEWRRFGSESNKNMIRLLGQLEEVYPDIAKILVANRLSKH